MNETEIQDLEQALEKAKESLEEIRDLARTSLAPMVYNMSEKEWALHRLNRIAGMAARELDRNKGETDGRN